MAASEFYAVRRGSQSLTNAVIHDKSLSYEALGVLLVMLACPPGSRLGYRELVGRGCGQKKILSVLRELNDAGFRWIVTTRASNGRFRDVTVVYDEPVDADTAINDVARMTGRVVIGIRETKKTKPQAELVEPQDSQVESGSSQLETISSNENLEGKTPSQTGAYPGYAPVKPLVKPVRRKRTHRLGTHVLRSSTQEVNKLTSKPNQTVKPPEEAGSGVVGGEETKPSSPPNKAVNPEPPVSQTVASGTGSTTGDPPASDDWLVIGKCLPAQMQAVDPGKASWVAGLLRKRLDAGWHPQRLRDTLAGNQLPAEVKNLTGLVAYRIKGLPVDPPLSASDFERIHARHKRDVDRVNDGVPAPMPKGLKRRIKALSK